MEKSGKSGRYDRLYNQLLELISKTDDQTSKMATIAAVLYHKMDGFFWCGFYRVIDGELIVGPYQGPLACQVLEKNRGVCWACVNERRTVIVPDVHKFPGHIACDSRSKSEIVVPVMNLQGEVIAVLDVDSSRYENFDEIDASGLEKIVALLLQR